MFLLNKFRKKFIFKSNNSNTIFYLIFTFLLLTLIYDLLYISVENMDSIVSMIYYNIVTASTVGYGDFSPQTVMGKVLTAIYIPIAISLFAAFLSVMGSIIYSNIHRRDNGLKSVTSDIEYLIIGGYKEKVDELVLALISKKKRVALINQHYDTLPLAYKVEGVVWVKGDVVSDNVLDMFDHSKIENYAILSSKPTDISSDMLLLYSLEKLLSYAGEKRITAEVIEELSIFPRKDSIRYMKVAKGLLVAKELLQREVLLPIEKILDNSEKVNQYNLTYASESTWGEVKKEFLEKELYPIGYLNLESRWVFSPLDSMKIEKRMKIKVIALSNNSKLPSEKIEQNILIIGENKLRIHQLKENYLLDKRYSHNSLKSMNSIEMEILTHSFEEEYTDIIILAELGKENNDTVNYFYWRYFREKFPKAKIVVELINAQNRLELERKYENSYNEFVSISQIGLMVQELQDEGMIYFIENLTTENIENLRSIEEKLASF